MTADNQSPAEPMLEPTLLALARKRFGALSRAEEELFRAAQEGRGASAQTGNEEEDKSANAANWPADRVVRAECIAWVCTDPQALTLVSQNGLQIWGMRIDGRLDLAFAEIEFPIAALDCAFSGNIFLGRAQVRGLTFMRCQTKGLTLTQAKIGYLEFGETQFANEGGSAFVANRAKIETGVFLYSSRAEGEVYLQGIEIGGDLICTGGRFINPTGLALSANGAKIEGNVSFCDDFTAEGEVNLMDTRVGGVLDCRDGRFSNAKGLALNAEASTIERALFGKRLSWTAGSRVDGRVSLYGATISNLEIRDIDDVSQLILDLRLANVKTFWDDEKSWPKAGKLSLDGFTYGRLSEAAPIDVKRRIEWLRRQPPERFNEQPFEQLSLVLRKMGHEKAAREIFLAKDPERARGTRLFSQGWWWYNVFGKLIGYGYRPGRAFAMSLAMILLGTILFGFGSANGLISPTSENAYAKAPNGQVIEETGRKKISEEYPVFNSFFYSLESFTPLLELDQSAHWTPNANRSTEIPSLHWKVPTGELLRYYLYFHIASGWLLTSLWVGAITGLVKT